MTPIRGTLISLRAPECVPAAALPNLSLPKMLEFGNRAFSLFDGLDGLHDPRESNSLHPFMNVMVPLFLMPVLQSDSFNSFLHAPLSMTVALKNSLPEASVWGIPSRDTAERVAAGLSVEGLRGILENSVHYASESSALRAARIDGYRLGIVDGTEIYCTRKKEACGEYCLSRVLADGTTEYFHRVVILSIGCGRGHLIADWEMLRSRDPGQKDEGELTGFKRIIERLLASGRRPFDILAGDALYCNAPCINLILKLNIIAIIRMKGENRKLVRTANRLFDHGAGKSVSFFGENRRGERVLVTMYYDDHFRMDGVDQDLRVVRIHELPVLPNGKPDKRTDENGKLLREEKTAYMVCTDPSVPVTTIWKICHYRWDVEQCIHQLKTYYHMGHLYSHKAANQILALILIAFNLRELYLCRHRARDFIGGHFTRKDFTKKLFVDMCTQPIGALFASAGG